MYAYLTFAAGLLAAAVVIAGLVASLRRDDYQFYPPGENDAQLRVYEWCSRVFLGSILATGVLQFDAGPLPWPESPVVGVVLLVVGYAWSVRAMWDLGQAETKGRPGELQTEGLYRYSRNPQNLGYVVVYGSLALITNSPLVAVLSGPVIATWLLLQSLAEEPWLREQYGEAYAAYRREVPRFVGLRSFERALGGDRDPRRGDVES